MSTDSGERARLDIEQIFVRAEYEAVGITQARGVFRQLPPPLADVISELGQIRRLCETAVVLATGGNAPDDRLAREVLASQAGIDPRRLPRPRYRVVTPDVVRLSVASPLVTVLSLTAVPGVPLTIKALTQLCAAAWNLPVAIRRDRDQLEAESASYRADQAEEVLREARARAELLTLARFVRDPNARPPKSIDVFTGDPDDLDPDDWVRARDPN